jgi:hypothetical protein
LANETKAYIGEDIASSSNGAGKTGYPHAKTETASIFLTL